MDQPIFVIHVGCVECASVLTVSTSILECCNKLNEADTELLAISKFVNGEKVAEEMNPRWEEEEDENCGKYNPLWLLELLENG